MSLRGSSMFHQDSLEYYRHRAYRLEEPEALYITAAAAYLKSQGDPNMDTLETVSIEVADSMLMDAAAQNYKPAIDAIHCLHENGCWHHEY